MKPQFKKRIAGLLGLCLLMTGLSACSNGAETPNNTTETPVQEGVNELKILATTDMHDYLMNYDYYTASESANYGLVKLATIIKDTRNQSGEINNVVLLDNGDLIQGNPLGDYYAKIQPVQPGETHPIYQAFEALGYDAAGLGNHEFNYGLDYLKQIIKDTSVPVINANVYNAQTKEHEFTPYVILDKSIASPDGTPIDIKVGVISFVPTQILNWDKLHLEGKVTVDDIKKTADELVPKMKEEGADIVIALAHSGYGSDGEYVEGSENMAYYLTMMDGIDVVIGGHSHTVFPTANFVETTGFKNVNLEKGTINDTFTVQPAKYAEGIGLVTLRIEPQEDTFAIVDGKSEVIMAEGVNNDPEIQELLMPYHEKVIEYVSGPVGETTAPITSFFALVADDPSVQIVSDAQLDYGRKAVRDADELKDYRDLPILSAAAPFKAGLSKSGTDPSDYVNIPAGNIAIRDVANLYKYPNTVTILKLKGKDIREWLEMTSGMFNTMNATIKDKQPLLNDSYPSFNFDTIDGVTYEIDITKEPKYDVEGNLINEGSNRIVNLQYEGKPIEDEQEFLVITNNYRASGGGNFPIFNENTSPIVYSSSDENRQVVSDYIKNQGTITPKSDGNWKLAPIEGEVQGVFLSSTEAEKIVDQYTSIEKGEAKDPGLTEYVYTFK